MQKFTGLNRKTKEAFRQPQGYPTASRTIVLIEYIQKDTDDFRYVVKTFLKDDLEPLANGWGISSDNDTYLINTLYSKIGDDLDDFEVAERRYLTWKEVQEVIE